MQLNKNQAGLSLGFISALCHLLWVLAVALGFGQQVLNWILSAHFITDGSIAGPVTFGAAILGVVMAFVWGYLAGFVFIAFWNMFAKKNV